MTCWSRPSCGGSWKRLSLRRLCCSAAGPEGDARAGSDFDVLVIKHSDEPRYRRSVPIYMALADLPVEVEVMVYTPEEVEEWNEVPQAFVTTAMREGITIYERRG